MSEEREVRDALEADMAAHERNHGGGEVHAARNQALAAQVLEQLERDRAAAPTTKPEVVGGAPIEPSTETREIDGKKYTVDRAPDSKRMFRTASEFEAQVLAHAMPRLELLLSKRDSGPLGTPSWRDKAMASMYFKVKSLEAKKAGQIDLETYYELAYQQDLTDLLESSNQIFGDWRKSPEKKLQISVS